MLLELDVSIIEFFNSWSDIDFVKYIFLALTYLGNEYFFIGLIGTCYWAVNKKVAKEVGIAAFYAMWFNGLFKSFFNRLRPYQQSPESIICGDDSILAEDASGEHFLVDGPNGKYLQSSSSSFPSGHSQGASATFNSFAISLKKKWVWILATVLCVLVMVSRMVLGVHYLTDVLFGYASGLLIVELVYMIRKRLKNEYIFHFIVLGCFLIITCLSPIWNEKPKDLFTMFGVTSGTILGLIFEEKKVNFSHTKCIWKNIIRVLLGVAIVFALKEGLKPLFSLIYGDSTYFSYVFDCIRYFIMTFVGIGVYPILIKKWKLLNDKEEPNVVRE